MCPAKSNRGKESQDCEVLNNLKSKKTALYYVPFPAVVEPVDVAPLEAGDFKSLVQKKHSTDMY